MSTPTQQRQIIENLFRIVDTGQFDKLDEVLTSDTTYNPIGRPPIHGIDEVKNYYTRNRVVKDSVHDLEDFIPGTNRAVALLEFRGTSKRGEKMSFHSANIFEFKDGKISNSRIYTDLARLDER